MERPETKARGKSTATVDRAEIAAALAAPTLDGLARELHDAGVHSPVLDETLETLARRIGAQDGARLLRALAAVEGVRTADDLLRSERGRGRYRMAPRRERTVVLQYLQRMLTQAPLSRRGGFERPPVPPPSVSHAEDTPGARAQDPVPRSQAELREWAKANGITDRLGEPASVLADRLPASSRWVIGRGLTVEDVRAGAGAIRMWGSPRDLEGVSHAAGLYLLEMAAMTAEGLTEERIFAVTAPPAEPVLRAVWDRLVAARALVRTRRSPRPRQLLRGAEAKLFVDPPAFEYHEQSGLSSGGYGGGASRVRIDLLAAPEDAVRCSCEASADCAHVLSAIDYVRGVLVGPDAGKVAQALSSPAWERTLAALERLAQEGGAAPEKERLVWRLDIAGPNVRVIPVLRKPLKRGGYSKGREVDAFHLAGSDRVDLSPRDGHVLRLIRSYDAAGQREAVVCLVGHPDVYIRGDREDRHVEVREEVVALSAREREGGGLELAAKVGDHEIPAAQLDGWLRDVAGAVHVDVDLDLDAERAVCTVARVPLRTARALAIVARSRAPFPPEAHDALARTLGSLGPDIALDLPAAVVGRALPADLTPVVRLSPVANGLRVEVRVRPAPGGPLHVPGEGAVLAVGRVGAERVAARRELQTEAAAVRSRLSPLGLVAFDVVLEAAPALDLIAALSGQREAFRVEWPESEWRVLRASTRNLRIAIAKKTDWFGLTGTVAVDGESVALASVLAALRSGERYIELRPGMWLALEDSLRRVLQDVADVAIERRDGLEVGLPALRAMEDLAHDAERFDAAPEWEALEERIRTADALLAPLPGGMRAELRPYQVDGFRWLARLAEWGAGGVLADDMGLGKTLQGLALLLRRAPLGPALVVAPTSVCSNWPAEAARFAPTLRVRLYREETDDTAREALLGSAAAGDLVVVSYGLLTRDAERFAARRFATLVIDEAQAIKNAATRRARALRDLQADFRVALTGTPMENHLGELWSVFRCVFPALLGSFERFRERFAAPIERDRSGPRCEALARLVRPFLLRRTKSEVAPELPPRTEVVVPVELTAEERRLYDAERIASLGRFEAAEKGNPIDVLAAITRLRQLACHPRLHDADSPVPSSKLERFLELVEELRAEGHRALVFSQFTTHLGLVREVLDARGIRYEYLDGSMAPASRDAAVKRFQATAETDLFLISLKAGGSGLNLTAADFVIHLDPWWNPAVEDQASDRAHRIGQTRPVTVLKLVSRETIEEKILALHEAKRELVAGVLSGASSASALTSEQMLALLRER